MPARLYIFQILCIKCSFPDLQVIKFLSHEVDPPPAREFALPISPAAFALARVQIYFLAPSRSGNTPLRHMASVFSDRLGIIATASSLSLMVLLSLTKKIKTARTLFSFPRMSKAPRLFLAEPLMDTLFITKVRRSSTTRGSLLFASYGRVMFRGFPHCTPLPLPHRHIHSLGCSLLDVFLCERDSILSPQRRNPPT